MASKQRKDNDPLQFFNIVVTPGFPTHVLAIVDTERKEMTLIDSGKMDVITRIKSTPS